MNPEDDEELIKYLEAKVKELFDENLKDLDTSYPSNEEELKRVSSGELSFVDNLINGYALFKKTTMGKVCQLVIIGGELALLASFAKMAIIEITEAFMDMDEIVDIIYLDDGPVEHFAILNPNLSSEPPEDWSQGMGFVGLSAEGLETLKQSELC